MPIFNPASITWLRTSRRILIAVSMCRTTGPSGMLYRSLASSARTIEEPIAAARSTFLRNSATDCWYASVVFGRIAPPPVSKCRPHSFDQARTSAQCLGSITPGSSESCRKIASSFCWAQ
jgi:hypothetical protein